MSKRIKPDIVVSLGEGWTLREDGGALWFFDPEGEEGEAQGLTVEDILCLQRASFLEEAPLSPGQRLFEEVTGDFIGWHCMGPQKQGVWAKKAKALGIQPAP